jgi:hypothetical protein
MDYSAEFIQRAAQAAQHHRPGQDWMSLPIGERVVLIYREMQRVYAAEGAVARLSLADEQPLPIQAASGHRAVPAGAGR